MPAHKKFQSLGRGLDALISTDDVHTGGSSSVGEVLLSQITPNPNQPRREFASEALAELADSIKELGVVQPITLRQTAPDSYQIISGERRWRAAKMAGLTAIPAYIRTADDENVMEMALIENIQREDLNAIEIALAYQHLLDGYGLTQEQLSQRLGKNRATIANSLRLLKLPAQVQVALQNRQIDMGHARALLALDSPALQVKLFSEIQNEGYSVRKVEEMVKDLNEGASVHTAGRRIKAKTSTLPEEYNLLKDNLSTFFGTKVRLSCSDKGKGKITIPFADESELERIAALLDKIRN